MHPASHGDNPPAHAPGNLNPGRKAKADARKAAAAIAGARAMLGALPVDLTPAPAPAAPSPADRLDALRDVTAWAEIAAESDGLAAEDLDAVARDVALARAALDALDAVVAAARDAAPGSPRWTRTAEALRDAADAEGYDFDAYGSGPLDGYEGRGMYGREVPALTLRDYDEAVVVAARATDALGVRVRVDSLGRRFVVYPSRLVD